MTKDEEIEEKDKTTTKNPIHNKINQSNLIKLFDGL
jgi:hypothetical protein